MTDQELTQALADEMGRLTSYQCRVIAEAIARIVRVEALEQIVKDQRDALQKLATVKPWLMTPHEIQAFAQDALALTDAAGEEETT